MPEGHQGLHGFLYGEGGAEAHDGGIGYTFREGEDDGCSLLATAGYVAAREGEKPVGVYALYDDKRNLQYVGYARNVVLAVKAHLARVGEERCAWVRVMVFANKAMQSRAALQREADNWLAEAGTLPPGNGAEAELWAQGVGASGASVDVSLMSADELAQYEERKLKLRKAMGENLHDDVAGEAEDSRTRRLKLIAAVEGDDWSEVIQEQSAEAVVGSARQQAQQAGGEALAPPAAAPPIVTPFARASVHRAVGNSSAAAGAGGEAGRPLEMTVEAVDAALDDVRPYLIADGGNVDVVAVEDGRVFLQLQGACGTCPSSTATMKMGIERSLKAAFGKQLVEVLQVGGQEDNRATAEGVDMHLNMLRGAVGAYGGSVEVVGVEQGVCTLHYKGPEAIGYGLRAAVRDKFPDLVEVLMMDPDTGEPIKFQA